MTNITDTVEYLVKAIVTDPSSVVIESKQEGDILLLTVSAASDIIGQIIGKEGKIIKSIRTILNLSFPDVRYSLEIKD
jgi:predicted RNA-binding protein YlqC (UPF0109 family)